MATHDLTDKLHRVPTVHEINVYFKNNMKALIDQADHLRTSIANIPSVKNVQITINQLTHATVAPTTTSTIQGFNYSTNPKTPPKKKPGKAAGGYAPAGSSFWVGEEGPEYVTAGAGGVNVLSNSRSMEEMQPVVNVDVRISSDVIGKIADVRITHANKQTARHVLAGHGAVWNPA